jgi:hypothetical protein
VQSGSFRAWYPAFLDFLQTTAPFNSTLVDGFPPADKFYAYLDAFMNSSRGSVFAADVILVNGNDGSRYLLASRFSPLAKDLNDLSTQVRFVVKRYNTC